MICTITNLQRKYRIHRPALEALTKWLMDKTKAMNPRRKWASCSVVLVGHRRMTDLNKSVLHHDGTTDVITFRYRALPGEAPGWKGEIIINVDQAAEMSFSHHDLQRELALYLAHGCQHLSGADDQTPPERNAMSRRQNRWLSQAEKLGLIDGLIQ